MGSLGNENGVVVTQVSIGGFDHYVTAKMLLDYLENIGQVWRCRLKKSSTPPEAYPDFEVDVSKVQREEDYEKVEPHAFVHFAHPGSVSSILDAAARCELKLDNANLKVNLGPENPYRMNQLRRNKTPFKLSDVTVEIGLKVTQDLFFVGWRGPSSGIDFLVDPFDGTCKFVFTKDVPFAFKGTHKHAVIRCNFKVEFPVTDIYDIKEYTDYPYLVMILRLTSSPSVYYRTADDDIEETVSFDLLDDDDPWIRTVDFTPSGAIGRCNTYRILIRPKNGPSMKRALHYLEMQRVKVEKQVRSLRTQDEPDFGVPITDSFFCIQYKEGISFKTLFLVNALVHKCTINQHQLSDEFYNLLINQPEEVNIAALEHICSYRNPLYDAFGEVKRVQEWLLKNPRLIDMPREQDDIVKVRRLIITPSKAYCLPPEVELSNRVLRHYKEVADRFIRVTFTDEGMKKINSFALTYYPALIVKDITSSSLSQKTAVFRRIKNILSKGFYLCGRKYYFLAFSSNQLRGSSAWFFAENKKLSCKDIIHWMGRFSNRNVAKCAARMGQCFSSTYATVEVPRNEVDLKFPDVERNGYVFSDGIGKISPELAMEVAERLQLKDNPPCAYQIRYAGCKGVVACWPAKDDGIKLHLRRSMNKFESEHTILEICSWTRVQPGFLNRQIITLLSALDVKDDIFWDMQKTMVTKLQKMVEDIDVAFDVLTASCAEHGNTAALMLSAGFRPQTEPHLRGMLASVRAAQFEDLREKARIFVPNGRWLMGCFDELGILKEGQCFIQVSKPTLEDCFVKHGRRFSHQKKNLEVVKGLVAIAKNPCLHPGDVRILEAVDVPGLDHLHDCLIFPQNGQRPHTDEASGSDLDGDLYFVSWDENLLPPSKRSCQPMDYKPPEVKLLPRDVKHTDIIEFFSKNMVNESLGTICNAHVVHADLSDCGALDEKCIKLAELAATAVDFPKTGKIVYMPTQLKPKLYPDFMGKEEFQTYESKKILGKLYRHIKDCYNPDVESASELKIVLGNIPYDTELEISGSESFISDAWKHKCSYDRQINGLIGQYKLKREEEIVTGHIWSMGKKSSKKQGELKEKIRNSYSALRKEFRKLFDHLGSEFESLSDEEKNIIYEKKASAWYQVTYHSRWVKKSLEIQDPDEKGKTVILSFAWIAADYLSRLKIKSRGTKDIDPTNKPIDSLAKFLADRLVI